ncbi:gamma-glutamylcyclotransferase family protein [Thermocrinis sp.]|uniref:gamma-glutamylcyclotransferase family protein n=1 Tax=Thermocrinis sp. TaxID=2024383 RepID=UPI003C719777
MIGLNTKTYLFVYGTLKRGGTRNWLLEGFPFLGRAKAKGFVLYDLGPFPAMVPGAGLVYGEVYEVSEEILRDLDWIEGVPILYRRELIDVVFEDGFSLKAWAYIYNGNVKGFPRIEDGEWRWRNKKGRKA